jgi:hypothetical protein
MPPHCLLDAPYNTSGLSSFLGNYNLYKIKDERTNEKGGWEEK